MRAPSRASGHSYFSENTVAALATAPGGAISVIRVSGSKALAAVERLAGPGVRELPERKFVRASLRDSHGAALDDSLIVKFTAPDSYTGEDVVELHVHGGKYLAERVLEELGKCGVRQALPGEFSFRAVKNGKMTLTQAQAVADLIRASNDGAIALALEKMSGTQNRLLASVADSLRNLAVLAEAGIDFADQDIEEVGLPRLKSRIVDMLESLSRLKNSYDRGIRLQDGVRVAFIGLPNAGKSSFFNAILGEDRSIVSETAGTTRDLIREHLTLRGKSGSVSLRLEDTAGLRETSPDAPHQAIEKLGIERSQGAARQADLILHVMDSTNSTVSIAETFRQWSRLDTPPSRGIAVLTKADLANSSQIGSLRGQCHAIGFSACVVTSAKTGQGISEAIDAIVDFCEKLLHRQSNEVLLTRLDQLEAVRAAHDHLLRAQEAPEPDLFASDLRQALHSLGPLIGETPADDILGRIFSDFCIGK